MRITAAEWKAGKLMLTTSDPEAVRFAIGFAEGDYTISKSKNHRSLDANNYAWVLIDKLAAALHIGKKEVYRNTIRDIGGNSDIICMIEEAYPDFKRHWESRGDGWQTTATPSTKLKGCLVVTAYYGSSVYDTTEMSILIDHLVQDCKALNIETLPPDRLNAMMEAWDARS